MRSHVFAAVLLSVGWEGDRPMSWGSDEQTRHDLT